MGGQARDVGLRGEDSEDWEEDLLADVIPKLEGKGAAVLFERLEEVVESPVTVLGRRLLRKAALWTHRLRTSRSSPFMMTS